MPDEPAADPSSTSEPTAPSRPPAEADPLSGWIAVGEVMGTFGPSGDLRVKPLGRYPERFRELREVFVGDERRPTAVLHRRPYGAGIVLRLDSVKSRDDARALFGQFLYVPEGQAVKLPAGEYFVHQIIGLTVVTTEGETLGTVRDVMETGSNDVYVVRGSGKEVLLPAIKDVVKRVDLDARTMEVAIIPGLLD